jgi:hypothetical protein
MHKAEKSLVEVPRDWRKLTEWFVRYVLTEWEAIMIIFAPEHADL